MGDGVSASLWAVGIAIGDDVACSETRACGLQRKNVAGGATLGGVSVRTWLKSMRLRRSTALS